MPEHYIFIFNRVYRTAIDNNLSDAQKSYTKAEKMKPKSTSFQAIKEEQQKIIAEREAAKAKLDLWSSIKSANDLRKLQRTSETLSDANLAEQRQSRLEKEQAEKTAEFTGKPTFKESTKIEGNSYTRTLPDGTKVKGKYYIVPSESLIPSHDPNNNWETTEGFPTVEGVNVNDRDYKNDAQARQVTEQMAANYGGQAIENVPVVSSDGVVYDGNGRTIAGQIAAQNGTDAEYIQQLNENASNYGFTPEQIESVNNPRLVLVLDEDLPYNTETFAKFNAQEKKTQSATEKSVAAGKRMTESVVNQISDVLDSYSNIESLFGSEKATADLLKVLQDNGIIQPTEIAGLTENGLFSAAGREYITSLVLGSIFSEDAVRRMGNNLSLKNGILRVVPAILENRKLGEYSLIDEINEAITLLYEARANNMALPLYLRQTNAFEEAPMDKFSKFSQILAAQLDAGVARFREILELYNNSAKDNIGNQQAIFGKVTKEDIKQSIIDLYEKRERTEAGDATPSVQGSEQTTGQPSEAAEVQQRVAENSAQGERVGDGGQSTDSAGRTGRDSGQGEVRGNLSPSLLDVVNTLYTRGKEVASKLFSMKFFEVGTTPKFMQDLGLRGDKFTIRYGVISRHIGKDSSHTLTESDWEQLPNALQSPFAIAKLTDKEDAYRLYTTLQTQSGEFVVVGVDVKNAGREIEVNSISTVFGRRNNANLPNNEEVIYESKGITPEQSALLKRPDFAQYPTEKELSADKGSENSRISNDSGEKISEEEGKVNTNPTEAQKEAGNYKKGHVKIDGYDITIEQPKGSTRSGVDENGNKWETKMNNTYGYIRGTQSVDGDHIDVFLSDNPSGKEKIFIVQQRRKSGNVWVFDELKVLLGFDNVVDATNAYLSNYEKGWQGMYSIIETDNKSFKDWLKNGNQKGTYTEDGAWTKIYSGVSDLVTDEGEMFEPEEQAIRELRRKRDKNMPAVDRKLPELSGRYGQETVSKGDVRQNRRERGLQEGELQVDGLDYSISEQEDSSASGVQGEEVVNKGMGRRNRDTVSRVENENPELQVDDTGSYRNTYRGKKNIETSNIQGEDYDNGKLGKRAGNKTVDNEKQSSSGLEYRKDSRKIDSEAVIQIEQSVNSKRKTKPFAEYKSIKENVAQNESKDFPLTEIEYANKRKAEIISENPEINEDEAENTALDEYPEYISKKIESGELEKLYAESSISDRIRLGRIVETAGYEVSDISATANKLQREGKKNNSHKKGETVTIRFFDGSVVTGKITEAENGNVTVKSDINGRVYTVPEENIISPKLSIGNDLSEMNSDQRVVFDTVMEMLEDAGIPVEVLSNEQMEQLAGGGEAVLQARMGALDRTARTIRNWVKRGVRGKSLTIDLPVSVKTKIRNVMGRDFDSHNITSNSLVHILNNHGEGGKKLSEGSIPLREEDLELIPYIMVAPDRVEKSSTDMSGRESVRFYKDLSNGYVVVVEKEYKNSPDDMETITMWAEKSSAATNAQSKTAPDTLVRNAIRSTDVAKIRKDAETAMADDIKSRLMTVYHGSGAAFDAFDHNFMGTGEGAQAYGWGSYVTEVKGIGRTYAESTSGNIFRSGFGDFYLREIRNGLAEGKQFDEVKEKLLAHHAGMYEKAGGNTDMYGDFISDYETLQQLKESDLPQRNLYTIEIPDNTGENYLEWEGRADKIIDKVGIPVEEYETNDISTGRDVYEFLNHKLGSDKAASEFLSEVGFVGISYPAQFTTGGRSDNARNYVIFNENDLQIKDRISFMKGKKKASETVLPEDESSFKGTVVSDADGTKVLNNLDNVAKEYDKFSKNRPWTFLGDVAKALGARQHGSKSQYATFETVNGQVVTIRLSDHNASTRNFDNAGRENGISIVISRKPNQGITNDGNARLVEFFYPDKALQKAEGKPLAEIAG